MLKRIIFFLAILLPVMAQNNCNIKCTNVPQKKLNLLKGTDWIAVPWDDGSCYFHNIKTKDDRTLFPKLNINI
jgi:hypothetical protein